MSSNIFGWVGKILKIDLSSSQISELDTMDYADRFLGGRGIATRIYWENVGPEVNAFDSANYLILMTGPLCATGAQGASRFEVVSKSPMLMPERFCYGNLGGFFAPELKKAGYDGVVVCGRSQHPIYLWINDGKAEIKAADWLWGKGVYTVRDMLHEKHGNKVRFVTTGPAGENKCRSATLMTDHEGSATGGFGAVMGAKNLKAIAVRGTAKIPVADRNRLTELNRYTIHISKRGTLRMPLPKKQIQYVGKASCYQCGLDCIRGKFRTVSGKEAVRKCQSLVMYMPWVFARSGEKIDTAVDATAMCNDYSICTMEMHNTLEWLKACHEAGILTEQDIGLEMARIGSREFIENLISMITQRRGFGNLLAEGLLRTGEELGEEAKALFSEAVYGVGLGSPYSPREYKTTALLYALEPRQPINMLHSVSYLVARWRLNRFRPDLSPTTTDVFRKVAEQFWGSDNAWDLTSYDGKALAAAKIQDRYYVQDSLVLCDAGWPMMDSFNSPDHVGDPELENKIFSAVTGIETDLEGLHQYGERIFNQQRAVLLREGWQPKSDDYPAVFNFTKPIYTDALNPDLLVPGPGDETVSVKGAVLDKEKYEVMLAEFYQLRGWDPETGLQKEETLDRLDLSEVAKALIERNLV